MALTHLTAIGLQDEGLEKKSFEYTTYLFDGNGLTKQCTVMREGDTVKFIGLLIDSTVESTELLWNKINYLAIKCEETEIIKIPLWMLKQIGTLKKISNSSWSITLNLDSFIGPIPLISILFAHIYVILELNDVNELHCIHLIAEYAHLQVSTRNNLLHNGENCAIQQLHGNTISFPETDRLLLKLNLNLLTKGYFIVGDIDPIEHIALYINRNERYSYNRHMIQFIGHRIATDILYIPFNRSENWQDIRFKSYSGGLTQGRMNNIEMKIEYSCPVRNIGIYAMCANILNAYRIGTIRFIDENSTIELVNGSLTVEQVLQIVWKYDHKSINPYKNICPISCDEIKEGDQYCECSTCHNCFQADSMKKVLYTAKQLCPLCRKDWANWTIYTNIKDGE